MVCLIPDKKQSRAMSDAKPAASEVKKIEFQENWTSPNPGRPDRQMANLDFGGPDVSTSLTFSSKQQKFCLRHPLPTPDCEYLTKAFF